MAYKNCKIAKQTRFTGNSVSAYNLLIIRLGDLISRFKLQTPRPNRVERCVNGTRNALAILDKPTTHNYSSMNANQ